MTPEEHHQAGELFDRLRDLPYPAQKESLEATSKGDPGLYSRVSKLLEADRRAAATLFLDHSALQDAAKLLRPEPTPLPAPGAQIGKYHLGKKIGAGGMGAVFEADDTRLPRRVAIKILPAQGFASEDVEERIRRFEREARAASMLNHPNIVSILDAGFDQGLYYIAMEFVEGRTLRELIDQEPLAIESNTILEIVSQIASALSAAHTAGVIHRDIKPENIMIRPDGFVKVLDFGLASLYGPACNPQDLRTKLGHLAGTIQYLSPEQVLGKPATPLTDLFSLGVVSYELATRQRPFDGSSDGIILDAILNQPAAPPSALRATLRHNIEEMILQLLEKDPSLRFQTATDLKSCCKRLLRNSSNPIPPAQNFNLKLRPSRRSGLVLASLGGLVVGAAAVWLSGDAGHIRPTERPVHFRQLTSGAGEERDPDLAPDGKQFVYSSGRNGNWDIFLQRTGGREYVNLTRNSLQDDTQPSISPDGAQIAFRSERDGGGLFVMESTGENPRRITTQGYMPAWAPDNRQLVFATHTFISPGQVPSPPSQLYVLSLDDNSTSLLKTGDALQPSWSPHGYRIAYWGLSAGGRRDIFTVAPGQNEPPVPVTSDDFLDWNPVWSASGGQLYFLSDRGGSRNVWRIDIDEKTGRPLGLPEPFTVAAESVGSLAISGDGRSLTYSTSSKTDNLQRIAFDAVNRTVSGTPLPIGESHPMLDFSFSPDGTDIVYDTIGDTSENLWIMHADGTNRRMLTSDAYRNRSPVWSPQGNQIVFYSDRSGHYDEWIIRSDGSGLRPLTNGAGLAMQNGIWSPDGKKILAGRFGPDLLLDPATVQPVSTLQEATVLSSASGLFCSSWTAGPAGNLAACDLAVQGGYEAVVYSPSEDKIERTGLRGRSAFWAAAANPAEMHRALIFADGPRCVLFDRLLKRQSTLFSVSPNTINNVAVSPNGKFVYFTQSVRQGDLWLATLGGSETRTKSGR